MLVVGSVNNLLYLKWFFVMLAVLFSDIWHLSKAGGHRYKNGVGNLYSRSFREVSDRCTPKPSQPPNCSVAFACAWLGAKDFSMILALVTVESLRILETPGTPTDDFIFCKIFLDDSFSNAWCHIGALVCFLSNFLPLTKMMLEHVSFWNMPSEIAPVICTGWSVSCRVGIAHGVGPPGILCCGGGVNLPMNAYYTFVSIWPSQWFRTIRLKHTFTTGLMWQRYDWLHKWTAL